METGASLLDMQQQPLKHHGLPVHFTLYSDMILLSIEAIFAVL